MSTGTQALKRSMPNQWADLLSHQCQHGHKLLVLSNQCHTNGHDLLSYQCQHRHKPSYKCQHGHKLLIDKYQTNGHDLLSCQCQHGHKPSYKCQHGHNLSLYVSTRTKLLYHHNQSGVYTK